jgi:hypothetical protein
MKRLMIHARNILPNVLLASLVAAMVAIPAVGLLSPEPLTAESRKLNAPQDIRTPTVTYGNCQVTATITDRNLDHGDRPEFTLSVRNLGNREERFEILPSVTITPYTPANRRILLMPKPVTCEPIRVFVKPQETFEQTVTVDHEMLAGETVNVALPDPTQQLVAMDSVSIPLPDSPADETPNEPIVEE